MLNLGADRGNASLYSHFPAISPKALFGMTNNVNPNVDNAHVVIAAWTPADAACASQLIGDGTVGRVVSGVYQARWAVNTFVGGGVGYTATGIGLQGLWVGGSACTASWGSPNFVLLWLR